MSLPPLEIAPDEFAELARVVGEEAVRYLRSLDSAPIRPAMTGEESIYRFGGPAPEQGLRAAALEALGEVAAHSRAGNGRFFGYVVGSGEPVAALGDLFASVLNQNATSWRSAPAAAVIERTVLGWLAEALGCPGYSGTFTSGGSLANLMALAMAREAKAPANESGMAAGVVYSSSETHMSVGKAVALLGLGRDNLRLLPANPDMRLDPAALDQAIASDRAAGRTPIAVVANAGTIVTGAIDPIAAIVDVAKDQNLWVHVDGAYGAAAAMVEPGLFQGLDQVDSLSMDAHKWLYQPLDCSMLLYRDPEAARRTFSFTDDYAASLSADPVEGQMFFEETLELSRRMRVLKLWLSLRYHGLEAFRESIAGNIRQARRLAQLVDAEPALERIAEGPLSAVCFRWIAGDPDRADEANAAILDRVNRRGRVYMSHATVHGHFVLRACITNHRTTDADIDTLVEEVLTAAAPATA
jgi:aromatic-L-amino-acid/L-tryptophan decarboxylase